MVRNEALSEFAKPLNSSASGLTLPLSPQGDVQFTAACRRVMARTGHRQAGEEAAHVLLWIAHLHLLNAAVLQTPIQGEG